MDLFELFSRDANNATLSLMNRADAVKPNLLFSKVLRCISKGSLLQTVLLIFNLKAYLCQSNTLLNSLNYNDYGF